MYPDGQFWPFRHGSASPFESNRGSWGVRRRIETGRRAEHAPGDEVRESGPRAGHSERHEGRKKASRSRFGCAPSDSAGAPSTSGGRTRGSPSGVITESGKPKESTTSFRISWLLS